MTELKNCSLSPIVPSCNPFSHEKKENVCVCVLTLCPCLTDFDHIGQLLLSGRAEEMPEMCLCVSHILHCSCSYFTFMLRFSPRICSSGPSHWTGTFATYVSAMWTEPGASCTANPAFHMWCSAAKQIENIPELPVNVCLTASR